MTSTPFDGLAPLYDEQFSHSQIGMLMRGAVWRWLDDTFVSGHRIFELNCGTGEDAVYLAERGVDVLATDISPAMVSITAEKLAVRHLNRYAHAAVLDLRTFEQQAGQFADPFDGFLSNFGGLNCVDDRTSVARGLANVCRPGARGIITMMGRFVPWEWVWYLMHAQPRTAFRRFARKGAVWRGLAIHYPTISTVRREFAPWFEVTDVVALGVLVPPPYAAAAARRVPRAIQLLNAVERRVERVAPLPWLADHFLLRLERTTVSV